LAIPPSVNLSTLASISLIALAWLISRRSSSLLQLSYSVFNLFCADSIRSFTIAYNSEPASACFFNAIYLDFCNSDSSSSNTLSAAFSLPFKSSSFASSLSSVADYLSKSSTLFSTGSGAIYFFLKPSAPWGGGAEGGFAKKKIMARGFLKIH